MDIHGFCAISFGYGRVRAMNTYSSFFFFLAACLAASDVGVVLRLLLVLGGLLGGLGLALERPR